MNRRFSAPRVARRVLTSLLLAAVLLGVTGLVRPAPAVAHTGWAACKPLANGHLCFRGVVHNGVNSTDMLYHKTGGGTITARFYLYDRNVSQRVWDQGWFSISAGQSRTYIFEGWSIWWVNIDECMAVQGQSDVCVL